MQVVVADDQIPVVDVTGESLIDLISVEQYSFSHFRKGARCFFYMANDLKNTAVIWLFWILYSADDFREEKEPKKTSSANDRRRKKYVSIQLKWTNFSSVGQMSIRPTFLNDRNIPDFKS